MEFKLTTSLSQGVFSTAVLQPLPNSFEIKGGQLAC